MYDLQPFLKALVPVAWFASYSVAFAVALNSSDRIRISLLPVILVLASCSFWSMTSMTWPEGLSSLWGLGTLIHVFHTTSVLYLKRLPRSATKDCLPRHRLEEKSAAFATYKIWQDPQLLHRRYERTTGGARNRNKARRMFVGRRVLRIFICQTIHRQVAPRIFPGPFTPLSVGDFVQRSDWLVVRVLSGEWTGGEQWRGGLLRVAFTSYWLWAAFAMIDTANNVLAIAFVGGGLDEPEEWPKCFGRMTEAYTLGRFWSRFWHQMATLAYSSYARAVTEGVLRLEGESPAGKMVRALSIFLMSGATHAACSWRLGDKCGWSGDLWFFAACFGVIAVERGAGRMWSGGRRRRGEGLGGRWRGLQRAAGYVWVAGVLIWLVPEWQYQKIYCAIKGNRQAE